MKVLLIQDVDNLGLAGEVKEVAAGYGRNYLISQGLAVLATPSALKEVDLHRRRVAERRQRVADEMMALTDAVGQTTLIFQAKAGGKGRLYGSITAADVADKLAEAVDHDIDRRKLVMEGPIKELGTHKVTLRLGTDIAADFDVVVESLDATDESVEAPESVNVEEPAVEESPEAADVVEEDALTADE